MSDTDSRFSTSMGYGSVILIALMLAALGYMLFGSPATTEFARGIPALQQRPTSAREDPNQVNDLMPRFSSPLYENFACVRCSDSGNADVNMPEGIPPVVVKCRASDVASSMMRPEAAMYGKLAKGIQPGNYISSATVDTATDAMGWCRSQCEKTEGCKAVTHDKSARKCHFFYTCGHVVPSTHSETYDFSYSEKGNQAAVAI